MSALLHLIFYPEKQSGLLKISGVQAILLRKRKNHGKMYALC